MRYESGDRVVVAMPTGEVPGVVEGDWRPGLFVVRLDGECIATVVVGPHRLRPEADPPRVVAADEG